jgi:pectate lyase
MFKKNLHQSSTLLVLLSIVLLPFSAQAENCTNTPVDGQVYSLINAGSGKALDIYYEKKSNGANVIQWPYKASSNQQFLLSDLNNGYWSIKAMHSGLAVNAARRSRKDGGNILQWSYHGGKNQQWQLQRSNSGAYAVVSRHSGKNMSVAGKRSGGNVFQQHDRDSSEQLWYLNPIDGSCDTAEPTPEPIQEPISTPAPTLEPTPTPEPTLEPTPTPEPTQEPVS